MPKIAIIIPAYNEEKRIGPTLEAYLSYFNNLVKIKNINKFKIIVVLNACTDNTSQIVDKFKSENLEKLNFKRGGKGFAVIEGFKHALNKNYELIGFVDADMSTNPQELYALVKGMKNNDATIASRYIFGSKLTPKNTFLRILASRVYNLFIRAILFIPFRDTQCGAKMFKRNSIEKIIKKVGMTSWAFDIEILYLLNKEGFRIKEIPTIWSNKDYSKINFWKSGPWMALAIIRLRILNSPFSKMINIYDKFIKIFKPAR